MRRQSRHRPPRSPRSRARSTASSRDRSCWRSASARECDRAPRRGRTAPSPSSRGVRRGPHGAQSRGPLDGGGPGARRRRGAQPRDRGRGLGPAPPRVGRDPRDRPEHRRPQAAPRHPPASQPHADADETTTHRGIPITTPARTIIDLAPHPQRPPPRARPRPRRPTQPHRLRRPAPPPHPALLTSGVVPLHRRRHDHPQRDGGALPRSSATTTASHGRTSTPASKETRSTSSGGTQTPHRRGRRLRLPPLAVAPSKPTANATSCSSSPAGA